jgi:hypothetical protein
VLYLIPWEKCPPYNLTRVADPLCTRKAATEGSEIGELFSIPEKSVQELLARQRHGAYDLPAIVEGLDNERNRGLPMQTGFLPEACHLARRAVRVDALLSLHCECPGIPPRHLFLS